MDGGSCIDESTITDSVSVALSPAATTTRSPFTATSQKLSPPQPNSLCHVGSGASTFLDSDGGVEAECRKLPSSKYKGAVLQPNGRWGAQICEKHQRVWLGTFNKEDEAAQRFCGEDAVTNFKPLGAAAIAADDNDIEEEFLNSHSKSEIVDMLRKHAYNDELAQLQLGDGNGKRFIGRAGAAAAGDSVVLVE